MGRSQCRTSYWWAPDCGGLNAGLKADPHSVYFNYIGVKVVYVCAYLVI